MGSKKGHTQGVPLRGESRFNWAPKKGTHKGCPYGGSRDSTGLQEGAPTRGAPTGDTWFAWAPKKGTRKGCPYGVIRDAHGLQEGAPTRGAPTGGYVVRMGSEKGHPQGVPLRGESRFNWAPGKGTHKGCPYGVIRGGGLLSRHSPRFRACGGIIGVAGTGLGSDDMLPEFGGQTPRFERTLPSQRG